MFLATTLRVAYRGEYMVTFTCITAAPTSWSFTNGIASSNPGTRRLTDHEFRILNTLMPTARNGTPIDVVKRESPDFEVKYSNDDVCFVEVVEAVPEVQDTNTGTISNLERLRHHGRRDNRSVTYTADWKKYSRCIADRIDEKTKLAKKWEVTPIYLLVWVSNPVPTTPFSDYVVEAGLLIDSVSPFVKLVIGNPGQIYISS